MITKDKEVVEEINPEGLPMCVSTNHYDLLSESEAEKKQMV
jgi:hypothetical protein